MVPLWFWAACGDEEASPGARPSVGDGGTSSSGGGTLGNDGGASVGTVFLGRRCVSTFDCGFRLECLTVDSGVFGGEGPPGGYCTVSCDEDPSICEDIAPGATCQALGASAASGRFCALGCTLGAADMSSKCHERRDTACVASASGAGLCVPRCNSDTDCCAPGVVCGPARFCDHATGLCAPQRATGLAVGAPCAGAADDACRGLCREVPGTDPPRFACTEPCTFGASPACGYAPEDGPAPAYCYDADDPDVAAARSAGDGGWCVAVCDCGTDCGEGLRCLAFGDPADALATGRSGVCAGAARAGEPLSCDVPASGGAGGQGGAVEAGDTGAVEAGASGGAGAAAALGGGGAAGAAGGAGGLAGHGGARAGAGGEERLSQGGAAGAGGVGEAGVRGGASGASLRAGAGADVGGAKTGAPSGAGQPS